MEPERNYLFRTSGIAALLKDLTFSQFLCNLSDSLTDAAGILEGLPAGGWTSSTSLSIVVQGFRIGIPAPAVKTTRQACLRPCDGYIYMADLPWASLCKYYLISCDCSRLSYIIPFHLGLYCIFVCCSILLGFSISHMIFWDPVKMNITIP